MRYFFGGLVILLVMIGTARGGEEFTPAQARNYFDHHERTLNALVHLVSECKGRGTISIYPSGNVLAAHASTVRCPLSNNISTQLKTADVLWVNVSGDEPYGRQGPFGAMFVLFSRGLVGSGHGSAIYYFPTLEKNPFGDSVPLAGTPGHWFYRRY